MITLVDFDAGYLFLKVEEWLSYCMIVLKVVWEWY
jgi:hypothetical protein